MAALKGEDMADEIDQKDDGYIELVLRVLARMCDGQHMGLQVRFALYFLTVSDNNNVGDEITQKAMMDALKGEDVGDEIDQKDDGYIELVLRVLARMCDGQRMGLQVRFALYL